MNHQQTRKSRRLVNDSNCCQIPKSFHKLSFMMISLVTSIWIHKYLLKGSVWGIIYYNLEAFLYLLRQWPWIHRDNNII